MAYIMLEDMKELKYRDGYVRNRYDGKYKYSTIDKRYYIVFEGDSVDDINNMESEEFNLYFELMKQEDYISWKWGKYSLPEQQDLRRFNLRVKV